ncbi:MAG: class I SAM-dependent methyltransferase [Oscillospiraceae bacterium]|nr:class I SAM-dependent methyltransferase [Oscillospiraceae bacterium]
MALNWIDPKEFSFNAFLLLERFQIKMMLQSAGWRNDKDEWRRSMGIALNANPAVRWYFEQHCPESASFITEITENAPVTIEAAEIRNAEMYALISVEDFITYTRPVLMDTNCDFIYAWDKARLFEMADFTGKTVLDVGSGSGRLAFAAAEKAAWVYAVEPVSTLRQYLHDKIIREGIVNVRVTDGMADSLPYPDNTFDIVMSGHVIGDDYSAELAEIERVCSVGGWLLDCPGDGTCDHRPVVELSKRGWEEMCYIGNVGGVTRRYRKQVV